MLIVSRCFAPQLLARERSGPEITRGADLQWNPPRSKKIQDGAPLVAHDCDSVANAFRSQNFDRFTN